MESARALTERGSAEWQIRIAQQGISRGCCTYRTYVSAGQCSKLPFYLPKNIIRRDRRAVVVEYRYEFLRINSELDHHQAPKLSVAVLFNNKDGLVSIDETGEFFTKRKSPDAHRVECDPILFQKIYGFFGGIGGGSEEQDAGR